MSNIPDLSDFSKLSREAQKKRIDKVNNFLWDNIYKKLENREELIQQTTSLSEGINYTEGIAFASLNMGGFLNLQKSADALPYINRALNLFKKTKNIRGIIRALNNMGFAYSNVALYEKALDYYENVVDLAEKEGDNFLLSTAYHNLGDVSLDLGNFDQAKTFLLKSLDIIQRLKIFKDIPISYLNLGIVSWKLGEKKNAREYFHLAIKMCHRYNQKFSEPGCLTSLGRFYQDQGLQEKALQYHQQALEICEEESILGTQLSVLIHIGQIMYQKKNYTKAREYLEKALKISYELGQNYLQIDIYEILAKIEKADNNLESAFKYINLFAKETREKYSKSTEQKISVLSADFKYKQSEQDKEIFRLRNVELKKKSEELENSYNNISTISSIGKDITSTIKLEEVLDAVYKGVNSIMAADVFGIALLDKSKEEIDYRFFIENSIRVFPPRVSIHTKNSLAAKCIKQNKEIKIDDTKVVIKDGAQRHKTDNPQITQSLIIIPLISEEDIIGILTVQSYRKKQYTDYHLDMLKALGVYIASAITNSVNHEKLAIANKGKGKYLTEILDSIRYAERIQRSMLPEPEIVKSLLPNSFFLWQPKDIVGGDAYYLEPLENGFFIALFDCTGHGVPGAMMTMMATVFLRRIIVDYNRCRPAEILKQLNMIIKHFLKQDREETLSDDGLDAAICFVNPDEKKLVYAGAKLSLYYNDNGEIVQIKGDRQSIGYKNSDIRFNFTEHKIQIQNDSMFYMSTDGYIDQIGGEKNLPFGWKKFIKLLEDNQNESLDKQCEILESSIDEYKGEDNPQVDDITVIGFKI